MAWTLQKLSKNTLLLIPCSGKKQHGSKPSYAPSIFSALDHARATTLAKARASLRKKALLDKTLMPAYLRYSAGELYKHAATSIGEAVTAGQRVLIVSGGYGLILADEPIGWYERPFNLPDWPNGLLEECILEYARRERLRSVIAIIARTTNYAKLIRRVKDWGGLEAKLVTPVAHGCDGAQKKVPRAQGEAVAALINAGLDQAWRSSDGLRLAIESL